MRKTFYVGLGVTYHDPALAIVDENGSVVFAEATERYLQYKRALNCEPDNLYRLPELLAQHCPDASRFVLASSWRANRPLYERIVGSLGVLSAKGLLRRGIKRLRAPLPNYQLHHMMAANRNAIARAGLNLVRILAENAPECTIEFRDFDHHTAHAASAVYAAPFGECACAVIDSYGENGSLAFFPFRDGRLRRLPGVRGPGSLGLLYMKLTELCGFDWIKGEEWKVMGLAPYGRLDDDLLRLLRGILRVRGLELEYADDESLFGSLRALEAYRRPPEEPAAAAADLACTGQYFFAELMGKLLTRLSDITGMDKLALAGGCALNSSFNGRIVGGTPFRELYVPPAPADDGTALGAAWLACREEHAGYSRAREPLSPYSGSLFAEDALQRLISFGGLECLHRPDSVCEDTAKLLACGKLVAWVQGRAEFGPRALGNRSILADPRDLAMKDRINALVKFREEYRPFAPAILHEQGPEYFENYQDSPYMERTLRFRAEAAGRVPAVVHVDGTGRLQSVTAQRNERFYRLIQAFHRESGVPLLLNTSFNVMGKPMVHSVEDAISVFMTSGLDVLVIGDHLIAKPGVW